MPTRLRRSIERTQNLVGRARALVERTIIWRVWQRALENEFVDRSVALGAKAFVSLFPALLVVAAFTPPSVQRSILGTIVNRAGLRGSGLETVRGAFASSSSIRRATGVVGLIFTFFYVNSFTGALRRVYTKSWRRPAAGQVSGYAIGASWLLAIVLYFAVVGLVRRVVTGVPGTAVFDVVLWAGTVGVWWLTPWLMLQRQVRLRVLSVTAVLTGTALGAYALSATVWMPRIMASNQAQFGFFGVTLSLVTWLTGGGMIVVISACAGVVLAEDPGVVGRWVRGSTPTLLVPGAEPSFGAPASAPRLTSALGFDRGRDADDSDESQLRVPAKS